MIFSPDLAAKITLGQKTVTRRPVKPGSECRYLPGRTYAVQVCRGGIEVDRIRILTVRRERLDERPISDDEARAEGFATPMDFALRWLDLYGADSPRDVWRIEFEAVS